MLRSFRPQDFIHLPPLSEAGTLTLIEDLEAAVKSAPRKVPPTVVTAISRLLETSRALKHAIATREKAGSAHDPRARAADRALDDAWGAIQSWLLGWTRLPEKLHPRVHDARALYTALFPKGLQFLTYEFKDEWKESQARLDAIADLRYDALLDSLGGRAFLDNITRAHKAYGEALHITGGAGPDPDDGVQVALDATHMALREYVAQVAATVRRSEPESVQVADHLLAPLGERAARVDAAGDVFEDELTEPRRGIPVRP
jgi:hypothetical protein